MPVCSDAELSTLEFITLVLPHAWTIQVPPLGWMFQKCSCCCEHVWPGQSPAAFFICGRRTPEKVRTRSKHTTYHKVGVIVWKKTPPLAAQTRTKHLTHQMFNSSRHRHGFVSRNIKFQVQKAASPWFEGQSARIEFSAWAVKSGEGRELVWMSVNLAVGQIEQVKQYGLLSLPASQPTQRGTHGRPRSPGWLLLWQLDLQPALHTLSSLQLCSYPEALALLVSRTVRLGSYLQDIFE